MAPARGKKTGGGGTSTPYPLVSPRRLRSSTSNQYEALGEAEEESPEPLEGPQEPEDESPDAPEPGTAPPQDAEGSSNNTQDQARDNPVTPPTTFSLGTTAREGNVPPNMKDSSYRGAINHSHCRRTERKIEAFSKGEIILAMHHIENTDPKRDMLDPEINKHCGKGGVFSKIRPFIVMWTHTENIFVLPMFTFGGVGLTAKPDHLKKEFICVKNVGDENFGSPNSLHNRPLEAHTYTGHARLSKKSVCKLTGGTTMFCKDNVEPMGRLIESSYNYLLEQYDKLIAEARRI